MIVYHMSETLKEGDTLIPDYEKLMTLTEPFIQGLERGEECFAGSNGCCPPLLCRRAYG